MRFIELASPYLDLWDVNIGDIAEWGEDAGPSRFYPIAHENDWIRHIKQATSKPVVGVGRYYDPEKMLQVIKAGIIDIIFGILLILLRYDDVVQADGEAYWITLWGAAMILLGLLTIAMASGLTRGRNSARIFVTVLLSISLLFSIVDVVVSPADAASWWSLGIGGVLSALVILALWAGRSAEFFRRSRALPAA